MSAMAKSSAKSTTPQTRAPAGVKPPGKGDHVFLVDGSGYIFRAYHALPPLNRKSDGLQVNAVLGFCNMLWKLMRDMPPDNRPTHLAIVFDKSEVTFRNKIYSEYKAHRPPAPEDLIPQFALIREAVRAFQIPCIELAGYEADDLIATYARQAREAGARVTIVSSDKDLMQLVNDDVDMLDTMKMKTIKHNEVIEKFGVPPEKVVEVQALAGDSVDNVPGVPGIGIKTAAQLITEYGDLETLLARASEIKQPKRRESLIEHADKARISRELVLLDNNVKLDVPLDELAVHEPDSRKLVAFLKAMEFTKLTRRVAEYAQIDIADVAADAQLKSAFAPTATEADSPQTSLGGEPDSRAKGTTTARPASNAAAAAPTLSPQALAASRTEKTATGKIDRSKYTTIRTLDELNVWIARAHDLGHVAIDIKATSIDPMQADICGITLALSPNEACYIPLGHKKSGGGDDLFASGLAEGQLEAAKAFAALRKLLESEAVLKSGFDIKFTSVMLAHHDIRLHTTDDVQLMSYALDAGRGSHDIEALAERRLGHAAIKHGDVLGSGRNKLSLDQVTIERATEYGAETADIIIRLWLLMKARLISERMNNVYESLERPLIGVLARMERRGITIDRQVLSRLSGDFAQTAARLETEIREIAGEDINPGSPKQLGDVIFGKMGLPGGQKTKTGAWSTSASILEDLAEEGHVFQRRILDWQQVSKLQSTYTNALPNYVNPLTLRYFISSAI